MSNKILLAGSKFYQLGVKRILGDYYDYINYEGLVPEGVNLALVVDNNPELVKTLSKVCSVIYVNALEEDISLDFLVAGVKGLISSNASQENFEIAIAAVKSGNFYFPSDCQRIFDLLVKYQKIHTQVTQQRKMLEALTPSEKKVFDLYIEGKTSLQISKILHNSPHTIGTHIRHIKRKLGLSSSRAIIKNFQSYKLMVGYSGVA